MYNFEEQKVFAIVVHKFQNNPGAASIVRSYSQYPSSLQTNNKEKNESLEKVVKSLVKISEKVRLEGRRVISHSEFIIFSQWKDPWVVYAICDKEYKHRVGNKLTDEIFATDMTKKSIKPLFKKYHTSQDVDKIYEAMNKVEELQMEIVKQIDEVLDRNNDVDLLHDTIAGDHADALTHRVGDLRKKTAKFSLGTWLQNTFSFSSEPRKKRSKRKNSKITKR